MVWPFGVDSQDMTNHQINKYSIFVYNFLYDNIAPNYNDIVQMQEAL